ncbi:TPA: Bax inhibitor-1/YccA family protein [Candidatus Galligastranaerophilus intestinavium]|uniref:Bax inhibitor-1/YccA family protein n=1 Tax=Candidatus Galligastranaerophilus intestinavium TaxID=2840836 RepID=A0A9D1FI87_9BACT|nr:Bax inhibitor-1/YccA family protein [Candidatus Galligastranaerophilus intestinavium]
MTSNPMTQEKIYDGAVLDGEPMTVSGAVNKTIILLLTTFAVGVFSWTQAFNGYMDKVIMLMWGGIIAGFILAIIMRFKPQNAKVLSVAYAVCEGLAIGGLSAMYEMQLKGIVANAALITFLTLFMMLMLYKTGIIRATDTFKKVIFTATASIMVFYLVSIVISFFSPNFISIWNTGMLGIVLSVVFCAVAALNFILDFDFIEQGARNMAPKYFEWFGAFSLLVTIVWLYLELLRLLAQLSKNR